jgi:hypothetical protein
LKTLFEKFTWYEDDTGSKEGNGSSCEYNFSLMFFGYLVLDDFLEPFVSVSISRH